MLSTIDRGFEVSRELMDESQRILRAPVARAAAMLTECFASGGKVLVCGNGGSAADAQHFAAEFVGRFKQADRPGLPALALCADSAAMTAWSNDVGFESVFGRQVEAFGRPGDVLVAISTSGRSPNLIQALERARLHPRTRSGSRKSTS
jgi:phosphoheptose isomerase